jgi:hypothetical protein
LGGFRKLYIDQSAGDEWDVKDMIGGTQEERCYPIRSKHMVEEKW